MLLSKFEIMHVKLIMTVLDIAVKVTDCARIVQRPIQGLSTQCSLGSSSGPYVSKDVQPEPASIDM